MLDQLVIHESREDSDPHWDMRLDIDDMSYEVRKNLDIRYRRPAWKCSVRNVTLYFVICRNCWLCKNE
jgi:hypothetical protein